MTNPFQQITDIVKSTAYQYQGNYGELLSLLRLLEALHHDIRDNLFQPALPTNRQQLYSLLRDIEQAGGWPYIPRMKLQEFLDVVENSNADHSSQASDNLPDSIATHNTTQ
ncbi:MAG: hypothetical protein NZ772_14815 [Cyanobacteria bacterium]|nr:hypothetical protein [Cyanobacteriota bacterium]MDW8202647.1 hypothetical protein [Cyanobacteriota bacterium SKYGB_h_bin112]